ncbi:methyltransferase domain-containing protein [Nocardiopsis sp. MG754419]|uniref:methyltransferase domain-containing protein n=1 Tax=Nocardiopsis sp. MG754419 TaxID=2259865 RepID=UPI001BA9A503|nr:methyltransferase domain-containing protein [Nocardiopsis sp. MG754419]MBR8741125.1 protein-L-isoaspartate(D-aspartate) O-methyltransferase [Nocardiopsis sp. MG754419]
MTARERNSALIEAMIAEGTLRDAALVDAFRSVPRHLFIPETGALTARGGTLNAEGNPDRWLATVYADHAIVTRVEGPEVPPPRDHHQGPATSYSSAPTVLARVLELAELADGHRALEVGTGTGWNTALLAHRLGEGSVVSLEIDDRLLRVARAALREAGLSPATHLADGHAGYPDGAPYDRIISVCGVRRIPRAWQEQLGEGGRVVCPWGLLESAGVLMHLERGPRGTFVGRFHGGVGFVALRTPGSALPPMRDAGQQPDEYRLTQEDPVAPLVTFAPAFALSVMVPDWRMRRRWIGTGSGLWLCDRRGSSWVRIYPYGTSWMIEQGGPRSIWDEFEDALELWSALGAPPPERFGLVVEPEGGQRVWLDDPTGRSWPVGSPI